MEEFYKFQEPGEDRNKAERQERLGQLLTKEVHQREEDWLDYEVEDTQVRFDLADMILEELADEATQFLIEKAGPVNMMDFCQDMQNNTNSEENYYNML